MVRSIYKVAGQRRVIALVDLPEADSLDRTIMDGLPMAQYLQFEAIWPLREYLLFIKDWKVRSGQRAQLDPRRRTSRNDVGGDSDGY